MNFDTLANVLGYRIRQTELFKTAFTHKSFSNENPRVEHNERLEFLGDAVLELITTEYLFKAYPQEPEGKMTKLRSALVSGVSLATVAQKLGFGDFLLLSRGEEANGGRAKVPILANVFEAVVGAIYLEGGYPAAEKFIGAHVLPLLPEILQKELHIDPKSGFQEWAQEKLELTPEYRVLKESGPDHSKVFQVGVFTGEKQVGEGKGSSKQKAEVDAARNALEKMLTGEG